MQQTSLVAYQTLKNIKGKRRVVYNTIKDLGPICNHEIGKQLGWEINRVTGRVKELRELNVVKEAYKDVGPTGRRVIFWEVNNE